MTKPLLVPAVLLVALATAAQAQYMKQGALYGTVIVVGDDRIVVEPLKGGQVTIQAGMRRVADRYEPIQDHIAFFKTLKPGDKLLLGWGRDHTGHYYWREGKKVESFPEPVQKPRTQTHEPVRMSDSEGRVPTPMQRELTAMQAQVARLKGNVAQLKELIHRLVEARKNK